MPKIILTNGQEINVNSTQLVESTKQLDNTYAVLLSSGHTIYTLNDPIDSSQPTPTPSSLKHYSETDTEAIITAETTSLSGSDNVLLPENTTINGKKVLTEETSDDLYKKIEEIELYKFPNVTIVGKPTISNGQISGFSAEDYAQFPFLVDFRDRAFEIQMCFTTGNNVITQENIFDSKFGLAFAVRNKRFVFALSSTGVDWNLGEYTGSHEILPNTTYYVKFSWNRLVYKLEYSTDKVSYIEDAKVTIANYLAAKQIIIGKATDSASIFGGSVNLNFCKLFIMGQEVWDGMDDVGLATRLATDLSNIDEAGTQFINGLIDDKLGDVDEALRKILYG